MKKPVKILIITLGIIIGVIGITIAFLNLWLSSLTSDCKSIEIINFTPISFPIKSSVPLYVYLNDSLWFTKGNISERTSLVHVGRFVEAHVSPNSEQIAIVQKDSLIVKNKDGKLLYSLYPIRDIYNKRNKIGTIFFRERSFQWSYNSKSLFLIKDKYYESKGSQLFSKNGKLCRIDLNSNSMQEVISPFPADEYFFSIDENNIYFVTPDGTGDLQIEFFNTKTGSRMVLADTASLFNSKEIKQSIFINVDAHWPVYFGDSYNKLSFSGNKRLIVKEKSGTEDTNQIDKLFRSGTGDTSETGGLFYYQNDSCYHILKVSNGIDFKDMVFNISLNDAFFMPDDKYAVVSVFCPQYKGKLIFNLEDKTYSAFSENFNLYFSITSYDLPKLGITRHGITSPYAKWRSKN